MTTLNYNTSLCVVLQILTTVAVIMEVANTSVLALEALTDVNATMGTGYRGMESVVKVHKNRHLSS